MSIAEAALVKPMLPSSTLRSYAMIGIVLYAFGLVLYEIGNGLTQFWLVPYAVTMSALGFVVALYTASLAGVGTRVMVLIGVIYGVGTFYVSGLPGGYSASGVQIGSDSMSHDVGLGLVGFTMILLVGLAFYLTRIKRARIVQPKQDPGSAS